MGNFAHENLEVGRYENSQTQKEMKREYNDRAKLLLLGRSFKSV